MIWLTAGLAAGWTITASLLASQLRSMQRAHARREDLLLNQLLHVAGRPWQPAPATEPALLDAEPRPATWTATPEQDPVY